MPVPGLGITYRWTDEYADANGPDGEIITATVHMPWNFESTIPEVNSTIFPATMLGTAHNAGGKIIRTLPNRHMDKRWLYCTQCDLTGGIGYPSTENDGSIKFTTPSTHDTAKAVYACTWSFLGYDVEDDGFKSSLAGTGKELCRFVSRKVQTSMEAVPIKGTDFKFTSDNKPIGEPITTKTATKELEYTWWHIPFPYRESTWDSLLGQVNSAAFDGRGRGQTGTSYPSYAIHTVFFASYEQSDPYTDPEGNFCCNTTFFFLYRDTGWNKFYRPGSGWVAVDDGAGSYPFPEGDLMRIFD